ncbi:ribosome recycling factor [Zavarzinia sp. CC-PAN008]|uniref:ribosome recycling factor n=1 Tax=Zavarzinia sp. CC-PAN008 TaxID=3243332 RepID=UPI003F746636
MNGALEVLRQEYAGLRTGRASPSLLDPVTVDAYGATMPINQVATVSVSEARLLTVSVWDRGLAGAVDKAIRNAGLGLNPQTEGATIRIPIPELNAERRQELAKLSARYAENAKIAVRNVRRDGMDLLKRMQRDGKISEDDQSLYEDEVQSMTDKVIKQIDSAHAAKEQDILKV